MDPHFSVSLHSFRSVADLSDWSLACSCFICHPRHARLVSLIFVLAISPPPDRFNLLLIVYPVFLASYPSTTTMPFPILPASFRPSDSISSMCLQSTCIYVCIHSCTLRYKLQRSSPLDRVVTIDDLSASTPYKQLLSLYPFCTQPGDA